MGKFPYRDIQMLGSVILYYVAVALVASSLVLATSTSASKHPMDFLSLSDFNFYTLQRVRWGEQSRTGAYHQSGKMFKYKKVDTVIGTIEVPIEDPSKLNALSPAELEAIMGTSHHHHFEGEEDTMLALELLEEGEMDDAIEILEGVRDRAEREFGTHHCLFASALADLGQAYFQKQDFRKAAIQFKRAAVIDEMGVEMYGPHNYAASANMYVLSLLKAGNTDIVTKSSILEAVFRALLESSDPDRYKVLINLSNTYQNAMMPIRAIAMLKLARYALKRDHPVRKEISLYLGTAYLMMGEHAMARRLIEVAKVAFEASAQRGEKYFDCLYQLASVQLFEHQYDAAFKGLSALKEMYEAFAPTHYKQLALIVCAIAQSLLGLGQVDKAIMLLEAAESLASQAGETKTGLIELRIAYYLTRAYDQEEHASGNHEKSKHPHERYIDMSTTCPVARDCPESRPQSTSDRRTISI